MALKYFTKKSYTSLSQMASDIRKELKSLCPIDSANIKWKRGVNGMRAVAVTKLSGYTSAGTSDEQQPQVVADNGYSGYFTVIPGTVEGNVLKTVKIVNGDMPDSQYAGHTDLGGVAVGEVAIPAVGTYFIYLILRWNGSSYTQYFSTESESDDAVSWRLAAVAGDSISQVWTGGQIYWGTRYFI